MLSRVLSKLDFFHFKSEYCNFFCQQVYFLCKTMYEKLNFKAMYYYNFNGLTLENY